MNNDSIDWDTIPVIAKQRNYPEHNYFIELRDGENSKVLGLVRGLKAAISAAKAFELLEPGYIGKIKFERSYSDGELS